MDPSQKIACLFPGQGAQYVGMGKALYENFSSVRHTFEQASDLLHLDLRQLCFNSDENTLAQTYHSQITIYVYSMALMQLLKELFPQLQPVFCAGLSLGEYSALTASGKLPFAETLLLVQKRAQYMSEACLQHPGTMAAIIGLTVEIIPELLAQVNLPNELWAANFNCPGQIVLSGSATGITKGCQVAKQLGAKRVLPLQVEGAFHSGLMRSAQLQLQNHVLAAPIVTSAVGLVMNCCAQIVDEAVQIKQNLIAQITQPILWQQTIQKIAEYNVDLYIEVGCGSTLSGMNRRIGVSAPTLQLDSLQGIIRLQQAVNAVNIS